MLVYYQAVCERNYLTLQNRTGNCKQLQYYVRSQKNKNNNLQVTSIKQCWKWAHWLRDLPKAALGALSCYHINISSTL